jgi:hypothetical protein
MIVTLLRILRDAQEVNSGEVASKHLDLNLLPIAVAARRRSSSRG